MQPRKRRYRSREMTVKIPKKVNIHELQGAFFGISKTSIALPKSQGRTIVNEVFKGKSKEIEDEHDKNF